MTSTVSSRRAVLVSFLVDLLDIVTNLVVVLITGSAVVFSEMVQGIADSAGSGFLVVGQRRAARSSNDKYPLGYSREAFFWALLSAMTMLLIGAGLSAFRGYQQLVNPDPLERPLLAIGVLILAVITNGYAVSLSLRNLAEKEGGFREAFRSYNRPLVKGALLRDVIGTTTSVVGLIAMLLYLAFDAVLFDALGALLAALMMSGGALVLIAQARALIAGRAIPESELEEVRSVVIAAPEVEAINRVAAIFMGDSGVFVDLDLDLQEDMNTTEIEQTLDHIEARVRSVLPATERVRVLLNSPKKRRPTAHD